MANTYQCENCKGVFEEAWTEEEARDELKINFPHNTQDKDLARVCDDCYHKMMGRLAGFGLS